MKGIILAGGTGSRLAPCTNVTNKHLLPIYDKPMIFYPIEKMKELGLKEIIIVIGIEFASHFPAILKHGEDLGIKINYVLQDQSLGIAHALSLTKDFVKGDDVFVMLGDNIFEDVLNITDFKGGAKVFLKEVDDPERFGVAEISNDKICNITEKPKKPKTNYAVTGAYVFGNEVFDMIEDLTMSDRGEYELTDVNNEYIDMRIMEHDFISGFWTDAGTPDSLFRASVWAHKNKGE